MPVWRIEYEMLKSLLVTFDHNPDYDNDRKLPNKLNVINLTFNVSVSYLLEANIHVDLT